MWWNNITWRHNALDRCKQPVIGRGEEDSPIQFIGWGGLKNSPAIAMFARSGSIPAPWSPWQRYRNAGNHRWWPDRRYRRRPPFRPWLFLLNLPDLTPQLRSISHKLFHFPHLTSLYLLKKGDADNRHTRPNYGRTRADADDFYFILL